MSISITSAAQAVASAILSLAAGGGGSKRKYQDQTRYQRDLVTQVVISSTLGLSAFFTFCVGFPCLYTCVGTDVFFFFFFGGNTRFRLTSVALRYLFGVGPSTEVAIAICCSAETESRCRHLAGVAGYDVRMDSGPVQDFGGRSVAICGVRCFCGETTLSVK